MQMSTLSSGQETLAAVAIVTVVVAVFTLKEWSFYKLPQDHLLNTFLNPRNQGKADGSGGSTSDWSDSGGDCD